MRLTAPLRPSSSITCQPMASPSRSGSVAIMISSAWRAASFRLLMAFFLAAMTSYRGSKVSSSYPSDFLGRSRMWPDEAATRYCAPRKRLMVLALVGDSTMISLAMIQYLQHGCHRAGQGLRGEVGTRGAHGVPTRCDDVRPSI